MNPETQRKYLEDLKKEIEIKRGNKHYHYQVKAEKLNKLRLEEIIKFSEENKLRFRCQEGMIVFIDYRSY